MIACYDLKHCPPTYDFVTFMVRVAERAAGEPVDIHILPGPVEGFRDDTLWPRGGEARRALLDRIVVPMATMLPGATVTVRKNRDVSGFGFDEYSMDSREMFRCFARGVRPLRPKATLPKHDRHITFTLRECEHWPERNSNVPEWFAAANTLHDQGYSVRIIRDTLIEQIDLEERVSVYRASACNVFVNNGPAWLCMAADAPTLVIRPACDELGSCYGSDWFRQAGVEPGGQIPNSPAHQRLVWERDTHDTIVQSVTEFMACQ